MKEKKQTVSVGGVLMIIATVMQCIACVINLIWNGSFEDAYFTYIFVPLIIGILIILGKNKIAGYSFLVYAVEIILKEVIWTFVVLGFGHLNVFHIALTILPLLIMGLALIVFNENKLGRTCGIVAGIVTIVGTLYECIILNYYYSLFGFIIDVLYVVSFFMIGIWLTKPYVETKNNVHTISPDELLKLKELLDAGVITQEEFEIKKQQLL